MMVGRPLCLYTDHTARMNQSHSSNREPSADPDLVMASWRSPSALNPPRALLEQAFPLENNASARWELIPNSS